MNRVLTEAKVNPNLKDVSYPWPCITHHRINEMKKEMEMGVEFPFKEIHNLDSANPQGMGQKSLTFYQQVITVCMNKDLLESDLYPSDVKQRAKFLLDNCFGCSIGAYSLTEGIPGVRIEIAKWLEKRDGVPSHEEDIYLSVGASEAIQIFLELFSHVESEKPPGILVPVPEYPLFKASLAQHGIHQVKYYLQEEKQWSIDIEDLQKSADESREKCDLKALVIINPGNPGGYVMTREDMEEIIKFAYKENILIIADEVYQLNIYSPEKPFLSFKKVMYEMGKPYRDMELASFMSASKGYMGECGVRIGFGELINVEQNVRTTLFKLCLLRICPPTLGQAILYCLCNPPEPGEPSHELHKKEINNYLRDMKTNIDYCNKKFNSVKGMSAAQVDSSMFFYPRVYFSNKAMKEATRRGLKPDELYCLELLEETGICTIPGCEFGQKPGTYHFRYAFLYPTASNKIFVDKILDFHEKFMEKFAD